jgi:hypothetical protein
MKLMKYMDFKDILKIIAKAAKKTETVEIYYPKTESRLAGWREVEPYSIATDIGEEGEHLVFGKEIVSPGHIFNAYTVKSRKKHCSSFILGKIKQARLTGKKFDPRWPVEF